MKVPFFQHSHQQLFSLLFDDSLYAGQEATVRTVHGTTDWFQIGKEVRKGCILPPCLFDLYAENIMTNAEVEEAQAGSKIARRNINNLRYTDDTTIMADQIRSDQSLSRVRLFATP